MNGTPPRKRLPSAPTGYHLPIREEGPRVVSESPPGGDVSFSAGPARYRGSAWVFLVVMAFVTPLAGIGLVLYMLPRVTGAEDLRRIERKVDAIQEEQGELRKDFRKLSEARAADQDEVSNRMSRVEASVRRLAAP